MSELKNSLNTLLTILKEADSVGMMKEADEAHHNLIKIAQQAQNPANAYSYIDPSGIPPALYSIIANLNYKLNTLETKFEQQSQQQSATQNKVPANTDIQQMLPQNQNTITPNTVNYIQTPGSNPAPIEINDGEINV
jgi:predicted DNA-binding helix-hairpin-helix protein